VEEVVMAKPIPEAPPAPPGSLAAALATIPDPRRPYGWRREYPPVPLVVLLQCCVAAILGGARGLNAIAQWVEGRQEEEPALLRELGLPAGRRPCAATWHRVSKALGADAFEEAVGGWLARTGAAPEDPLAVDGKTLRGVLGRRCRACIWWRPTPIRPRWSSPNCAPRAKGRRSPRPRRCWPGCRSRDGWWRRMPS
jgi:hypothetical protein